MAPDRLVFVDETWASTNRARRTGRSPRGQPLVCPVPCGHWKTTTFVAALRTDGMVAPTVIDGAMTGDRFVAWVEQQLAPTLRAGDVVVVDNLRCHTRAEARRAVEAAGAFLLFLPPYSPDLNPIDRAGVRQAEAAAAVGRRTDGGRAVGVPRPGSRYLPPRRVPQRLPPLRIPRYDRMKTTLTPNSG